MDSSQSGIAARPLKAISSQKTPLEVDLVRSYLRDIGRVPLLSHEQEITLGRQVQDLMRLENLEKELESANGIKPTPNELSNESGIEIQNISKIYNSYW